MTPNNIRKKRWILRYPQKIMFDCGFALFLLLCLDIGVCIFFSAEIQSWEYAQKVHKGRRVMSGNPYLIFEYTPGIWDEVGTLIHINSMGLRGTEVVIPKPDKSLRFITLGDSSIFGFGVPENNVFSEVAERLLNKKTNPKQVEAINGAIPGYSTYQSINLLNLRAWKMEPDLLVVGNIWSDNNFGGFVDKEVIAQAVEKKRGFGGSIHGLLTYSSLYRAADWKYRIQSHRDKVKEIGQDISKMEPIGKRRVEINDYAANLEKIISSAHARDAQVIFLMLANEEDIKKNKKGEHFWEPYRVVMKDVARRNGIPLISMVELFQKSGYTSKELFIDQVHPSILGHQILGVALAKKLAPWVQGEVLERSPTGEERPIYIDSFAHSSVKKQELRQKTQIATRNFA